MSEKFNFDKFAADLKDRLGDKGAKRPDKEVGIEEEEKDEPSNEQESQKDMKAVVDEIGGEMMVFMNSLNNDLLGPEAIQEKFSELTDIIDGVIKNSDINSNIEAIMDQGVDYHRLAKTMTDALNEIQKLSDNEIDTGLWSKVVDNWQTGIDREARRIENKRARSAA